MDRDCREVLWHKFVCTCNCGPPLTIFSTDLSPNRSVTRASVLVRPQAGFSRLQMQSTDRWIDAASSLNQRLWKTMWCIALSYDTQETVQRQLPSTNVIQIAARLQGRAIYYFTVTLSSSASFSFKGYIRLFLFQWDRSNRNRHRHCSQPVRIKHDYRHRL